MDAEDVRAGISTSQIQALHSRVVVHSMVSGAGVLRIALDQRFPSSIVHIMAGAVENGPVAQPPPSSGKCRLDPFPQNCKVMDVGSAPLTMLVPKPCDQFPFVGFIRFAVLDGFEVLLVIGVDIRQIG